MRRIRPRVHVAVRRLSVALCLVAIGCSPAPGPGPTDTSSDVDVVPVMCGPEPAPEFEDHTLAGFSSEDAFKSFADVGEVPLQVKFVLTDFSEVGGPAYFLDARFYSLHDEWFWFRLLNGAEIPCLDVAPAALSFETVADVYDAMVGQPAAALPLDLRFTASGRLYSPQFYELGLFEEPRFFGLGALLYYPPNPERALPDALWLFELQFGDEGSLEQIERFHERLMRSLPPEIATELRWLARSDLQEQRGALLDLGGGPLSGKVVSYADLVVAGNVESYNEGIVAGRIVRVPKGELGASSVGPRDIVVMEEVPDYLPPVAAIVTAVPQTPLAHLNLLAKSRGTPNAHVAGVMTDKAVGTWDYYNKAVLLQVSEDAVLWEELSQEEYEVYLDKLGGGEMTIPAIDLTGAPWTVDLTEGGLADVAERIPLTGGKAAAMAAFNDFPQIRTPATPLAVTIRAYADHIAPLKPTLEAILSDADFMDESRVRFVTLEGEEGFREEHAGDDEALTWLDEFLDDQPDGSLLGELIAAGGVKRWLRDAPLPAELEASLNSAIAEQFQALSPLQGLRFRSSSTAEDIQGFNGAGLYDSNTGYLDPTLQSEGKLQDRDVAWALKKTWASYWGFEAFAERRDAGIDHLSGHMGVLVHPRFDDALEAANGVITLYLAREAGVGHRQMIVNAQAGAVSVTNPDPDNPTTPELTQVVSEGEGAPVIERLQSSSETSGEVMTEAELLWLFDALLPLTDAWLDRMNEGIILAQQRSTLVLDFEFKRMSDGWPALASGEVSEGGLVLKQVRLLDSPLPPVSDGILNDAVPRDILEQVVRVSRRVCAAGPIQLETTEYLTDPAKSWALDHAVRPFNSTLTITFVSPALGVASGTGITVDHTEADIAHPQMTADSPWTLAAELSGGLATLGLSLVTMTDGGQWSLVTADDSLSGEGVSCELEELHEGPAAYLLSLLE